MTRILRAGGLAIAVAVLPNAVHSQSSWCFAARPEEPLLRDITRLLKADDPDSVRHRTQYHLSRDSAVTVIRDEPTCRRASQAYWDALRRSVPDLFGKHGDTPVLAVRVGSVTFVDDQRSRDGDDPYWEVMVFDADWKRLSGYGAGADNEVPRPAAAGP